MSEELKGLIEKLREEGIAAGETRARAIEDAARARAEAILKEARREAERTVSDARSRLARAEESQKAALVQAARDTTILLRKEINHMLENLVASRVKDVLTPEELAKIVHILVKGCAPDKACDIVISLKKEDLERLKHSFLAELKEELKKGITLKPSDEITGGLTISFDRDRSHFDMTDKAISEYISDYLKPSLAEILKEAAGGKKA